MTERIGLGAATIIPFRHPIHLAYSVASMSWMTRRPFDLGIGAGNFQHEFDVIGQGDIDRPADDAEQTLIARELWTGETVEWHSELYDFEDVDLKPQPLLPGAGLVGRRDAGRRPGSRSTSARAGCRAGSRSRPTRHGSRRSAR